MEKYGGIKADYYIQSHKKYFVTKKLSFDKCNNILHHKHDHNTIFMKDTIRFLLIFLKNLDSHKTSTIAHKHLVLKLKKVLITRNF